MESNLWISENAEDIKGDVLSIGSYSDKDSEGNFYRDYFRAANSYTTSDIDGRAQLKLDIRDMSSITDERYDCLFVSGVLEHVDDFHKAISEMTRILKPNGTLLLGVPFRQPIHMGEQDFWRFTKNALEYLFNKNFNIQEIKEIYPEIHNFPISYWMKAEKYGQSKNAKL